ncbi:MAG: bifunctional hydroxymethylpyrimidine kinase/phosphomethylpyrimidine kinase [Planctomycetes bacterium]|nr:bifunctional hydroxymethylpyrimidine kinase/phosphomethylpyrimidine kinase [Planctomycetota bacterium]
MILAAGLSPAWQQIVMLDRLRVGEVNRARDVQWCASGKALNVGRAAHCLAGGSDSNTVQTLSTIGGLTGHSIRDDFERDAIPAIWIETQAPTRVCTTILDRESGATTELVENAQPILPHELAAFRDAYRQQVAAAELAVLAGSFPGGVPVDFYHELLADSKIPVILDCQREPLLAALARRPFLVKPNREELGNTLGRPVDTESDLHAAMRDLCRRGATWVVVTAGKQRVWIGSETKLYSAQPPQVETINPIGCGDCLAAGIAVGLTRGFDVPDAVLFGMAAAAENARQLLPARLDRVRVAALREEIRPAATVPQ